MLPTALDRVRRKLSGSDDGDRQMVKILAAVLTDGLLAVEAACLQALSEGVHSADVVIRGSPLAPSVATQPGQTLLTSTPVPASSAAMRRVSAFNAAFDAL